MRCPDDEEEAVGRDSFLDVMANIVGILILLVMVVGARAAIAPDSEPIETATSTGPSEDELRTAFNQAAKKRADVNEIVERSASMHLETVRRESERMRLQTLVSAVSAEIKQHREKLSLDQQLDFDLRRQLAEAKIKLEDLTRRELGITDATPEVVEIQNLPTPIAQSVEGEELHVRLAAGHLAVVPIDELIDAMRDDARQNMWRLEKQPTFTSTVGPISEFRLKYVVRERQVSVPGRGTASIAEVARWQLMPSRAEIGEPVDQALLPDSKFLRALADRRSTNTTVTIWVYPDSFRHFRTMKDALFDRGFTTAARPLPDGIPIAGSPHGTRSSAE